VSRKKTRDFPSDLISPAIGFINCVDVEEETVVMNAVNEMLVSIVDGVYDLIGGNEQLFESGECSAVLWHHFASWRNGATSLGLWPRSVSTQVQKRLEHPLMSRCGDRSSTKHTSNTKRADLKSISAFASQVTSEPSGKRAVVGSPEPLA
jgi:hypothetical protein